MTDLPANDDFDQSAYEDLQRDSSDQDSMMENAEMVPVSVLAKMREFARRPGENQNIMPPGRYNALKRHIAEHGVTSPLWIDYHPEHGVAHLSEGNHRLAIAQDLGITHLPAVVYRSRRKGRGSVLPVTYTGEMNWDGDCPQYMKPSDFPELQSSGEQPPSFRTAAYQDFAPETGFGIPQDNVSPDWDEQREEWLPREGGENGPPPFGAFDGHDQNDYDWTQTYHLFDPKKTPVLHPDHVDEKLRSEHWKDNFVGPDTRKEWMNPMDALRDHAAHLAAQHDIRYVVHPEWNDTVGRSDYAEPVNNAIHVRPVTNRMRYLTALHEIAHNVGGTPEDHAAGIPKYGPHVDLEGNNLPGRIPLDYDREYKPKGWEIDWGSGGKYTGPMGEDPSDIGFHHPHEWEITRPDYDPDMDAQTSTSPFNEEENKLETEARAWDWAIQHSAVKVTPQLLRQMYRFLTSYANPSEIGYYSPTFKRLWNEGEHRDWEQEGWHDRLDSPEAEYQRMLKEMEGEPEPESAEAHNMEPHQWSGDGKPLTWIHPPTGEIWEMPNEQHPVVQQLWDSWNQRGRPVTAPIPFRESAVIPYVPSKGSVRASQGFAGVPDGMTLRRGNAASEGLTEAQAGQGIKDALSTMPELRKKQFDQPWRSPMHGHCYTASEAFYHLMGGKDAGYKPMQQRVNGVSHWWVQGPDGTIHDLTADQFDHPVQYDQGIGRGFLTAAPSKRAQAVMNRVHTNHSVTANFEDEDWSDPAPAPGAVSTDYAQPYNGDPKRIPWLFSPDGKVLLGEEGQYHTDIPGRAGFSEGCGVISNGKAEAYDFGGNQSTQRAIAALPEVQRLYEERQRQRGQHVAKSGADHDGAMVALMLKPEDADKLYIPGGEPKEDMHITLVYFQDKAKDRDDWDELEDVLENVVHEFDKMKGEVGGTGTFAPKDKGKPTPYFATPDLPGINELQTRVQDAAEQAGFPISKDHSFNPHITLKYMDDPDYHEEVEVPSPLSFDDLTLMVGGARKDFPLQGDIVKTSEWREDEHPRSPSSGRFKVGSDVHEVKVYDKKTNSHKYTVKRCDKCGVLYGEKPGDTVTNCPTCGEHPKRHSSATVHQLRPRSRYIVALDQQAVADSLGWRFWKTNQNGHKMYQWSGPNQFGETVPHTVAGYSDHGDADWDAQKLRKQMRSCMNGACSHVALAGADTAAAPQMKSPVLRKGSEVMYGGNHWWLMEVDGGLAHIYDQQGAEDIVPADRLQATGASRDRIDRNRRFVEELENRWDEIHNERDPDFVFVWFGGKLKVEAWEPNLRVRVMADDLIKEHGFTGLGDYEEFSNDTTSKWVTGEIWRTEAGNLKVDITQLADADVIEAAKAAVEDYFSKADDAPDYTRLVYPVWTDA